MPVIYFSSEGAEHKLGIPPVSEYVAVDCEMVGVGEKIKSALGENSKKIITNSQMQV